MIPPEADLAAAIPRRQFASLDEAIKYFHHRLLAQFDRVLSGNPRHDRLGLGAVIVAHGAPQAEQSETDLGVIRRGVWSGLAESCGIDLDGLATVNNQPGSALLRVRKASSFLEGWA